MQSELSPNFFQESESSLRDLYVDREGTDRYLSPEVPLDERLCGSVFSGSLSPDRVLTLTDTGYSVPQKNRRTLENSRKDQSLLDSQTIEQQMQVNSLLSGRTNIQESLPIQEKRVAVTTTFLVYDPETSQFYVVFRENDDWEHNPMAGCLTNNAAILEIGNGKVPHPAEVRMSTFGDIIPFRNGEGGAEYDWPFADNRSFPDYRTTIANLSGANSADPNFHLRTNPYRTIALPNSSTLDIQSNDGKKGRESGYTMYEGPAQTIECGKMVYVGNLTEIAGFRDGQWGGHVVALPIDGIMNNFDHLLENNADLEAQKHLDPSRQIYETIPNTRVFSHDGRTKPIESVQGLGMLHNAFAPNAFGMLRALHEMRDQGLDPNQHFKNVLENDYDVQL